MTHWWSVDDITVDWLVDVVGSRAIEGFSIMPLAVSPSAVTVRALLDSPDPSCPRSVIVAAANPAYTGPDEPFRREYLLYTSAAAHTMGTVSPCLHGRFDPSSGEFWLVLHDVGPVRAGDELVGMTRGKALLVVAALADVHTTFRADETAPQWLPQAEPIDRKRLGELYVAFVEKYGEQIDFRDLAVANRIVSSVDAIVSHQQQTTAPRGLVHGDFRLGNIYFGRSGSDRPITISHWQKISWGLSVTDLATFIGTALDRSMRLEFGDTLIRAYQDALGPQAPGSEESLRRDIRDSAFVCLVNTLESSAAAERNVYEDKLWLTLFRRACSFLLDLDAPQAADLARSPSTYVTPTDERAHHAQPGGEWNETWYLDVADPVAGIGAFIRFGVSPQYPSGWFTLAICGPAMPTVTLFGSDFEAMSLDAFGGDGLSVTHDTVIPLVHVHMTVEGTGEIVADPPVALSGGGGRRVGIALDLHWYTSGSPFQYDLTRVYEVPCMVTGTITLRGDGLSAEPIAINAPGQRDHAWDGQNWWNIQWFWLSAHFDDGTHIHGVDIRVDTLPAISMGYSQPPGAPIVGLTKCRLIASTMDSAQVSAMTFALEPGSETVTFLAVAQGPQRTHDGHRSSSVMPRAWGEFTRSDGRQGVGWVEWNTGSPTV